MRWKKIPKKIPTSNLFVYGRLLHLQQFPIDSAYSAYISVFQPSWGNGYGQKLFITNRKDEGGHQECSEDGKKMEGRHF